MLIADHLRTLNLVSCLAYHLNSFESIMPLAIDIGDDSIPLAFHAGGKFNSE